MSIKSGQPTNTITQVDGANLGSVQNSPTHPYGADDAYGLAQPNAAPARPTMKVVFKPSS